MSRVSFLMLLAWVFAGAGLGVADDKKSPAPETPAWLAEWEYPKAYKVKLASVAGKLYNAAMTTPDDMHKVHQFYQKKVCVIDKTVKSADGKQEAKLYATTLVGGLGSHMVMEAAIDEKEAAKLNITADSTRILYGSRDDSAVWPKAEQGEAAERPVKVRILFQDTNEYNLHVVMTRAKGEDRTHVVVTYIRK